MTLRSAPRTSVLLAAVACLLLGSTGGAVAGSMITGEQIKDGTVTTRDVKDRSLDVRDLKPGAVRSLRGAQGPAGADGATGPQGLTGPAGPVGPSGVAGLEVVETTSATVPSGTSVDVFLECPDGKIGLSAGAFWLNATNTVQTYFGQSVPEGWSAQGRNTSGVQDQMILRVLCASVG